MKRSENEAGMMTVESAFLVPMILAVSVVLLLFMMFLEDMAVVKGEAQRTATEMAAVWKSDGRLWDGESSVDKMLSRSPAFLLTGGSRDTGRGKKRMLSRIRKRLCLGKVTSAKVSVGINQVKVRATVAFSLPGMALLRKYAPTRRWAFTASATAPLPVVEEKLRQKTAQTQQKKGGD